ncbi:MAG: hypothetical protein A2172_00500 [Candidatus Woykebacteria bacterium RBG_13_40_15]|uniref:UPF0102 protein A2172_00500 n=1 Tax=Candidatus Woykebacteria bacterium RBG_13_40_15 TaxID=1802593 RepID=A0A1G1W9X7_9BACT|nr:MAG: hypothetical protein A2172_00500 [Candidatus Woykebacteria bacterium RBG_13_40_15]
MGKEKKELGKVGEQYAAELLKTKGYKILQTNFQTRLGEIDIVAIDGETLVFVEVKTRIGRVFGLPEEAVGFRKLRSIIKVGEVFRLKNQNLPESERIDVAAIELDNSGKVLREELIKNVTG